VLRIYKRIKSVLRIYMKETASILSRFLCVYTIGRSAADQSRLFWLSLKGWFHESIECWQADNNSLSRYNMCSRVGNLG
jgi:hypothetical protein